MKAAGAGAGDEGTGRRVRYLATGAQCVLAVLDSGLALWLLIGLQPPDPFLPGIALALALSFVTVVSGWLVVVNSGYPSDGHIDEKKTCRKVRLPVFLGVLSLLVGLAALGFQAQPLFSCWMADPAKHTCCPATHSLLGNVTVVVLFCTVLLLLLQLPVLMAIFRQAKPRRSLPTRYVACLDYQHTSLIWKPPQSQKKTWKKGSTPVGV